MPTVLSFGGLRVTIYLNDHRPAHVHVIGQDHEAVFALNCPSGPASLRENYGFSKRSLARMHEALQTNLAALCSAWEKYHGHA
jgi:hypothetical protein